MFKLFQSHTIYIRFHKNRIEVKNLKTGKSIDNSTLDHFSNERLIIADFLKAEMFLRVLLKKVSNLKGPIQPSCVMLIQPVDDQVQEFSSVEIRAFLDSAEHAGGKEVYFYEPQEKLPDEKVFQVIKEMKKDKTNIYKRV